MDSEKNYMVLPDGTRRPIVRGGVRQELTEADIIYNHYQYARASSDIQLRRHYRVSTSNNDTCGTCYCCICGRVLQERRAEAIRNTPEFKARMEKRLKENEQRIWDKHMKAISPKG